MRKSPSADRSTIFATGNTTPQQLPRGTTVEFLNFPPAGGGGSGADDNSNSSMFLATPTTHFGGTHNGSFSHSSLPSASWAARHFPLECSTTNDQGLLSRGTPCLSSNAGGGCGSSSNGAGTAVGLASLEHHVAEKVSAALPQRKTTFFTLGLDERMSIVERFVGECGADEAKILLLEVFGKITREGFAAAASNQQQHSHHQTYVTPKRLAPNAAALSRQHRRIVAALQKQQQIEQQQQQQLQHGPAGSGSLVGGSTTEAHFKQPRTTNGAAVPPPPPMTRRLSTTSIALLQQEQQALHHELQHEGTAVFFAPPPPPSTHGAVGPLSGPSRDRSPISHNVAMSDDTELEYPPQTIVGGAGVDRSPRTPSMSLRAGGHVHTPSPITSPGLPPPSFMFADTRGCAVNKNDSSKQQSPLLLPPHRPLVAGSLPLGNLAATAVPTSSSHPLQSGRDSDTVSRTTATDSLNNSPSLCSQLGGTNGSSHHRGGGGGASSNGSGAAFIGIGGARLSSAISPHQKYGAQAGGAQNGPQQRPARIPCVTMTGICFDDDSTTAGSINNHDLYLQLMSVQSLATRAPPRVTQAVEVHDTDDAGYEYINKYIILDDAGKGRFGEVKIAQLMDSTDETFYAIKCIPRSKVRQRLMAAARATSAGYTRSTANTNNSVLETDLQPPLLQPQRPSLSRPIDAHQHSNTTVNPPNAPTTTVGSSNSAAPPHPTSPNESSQVLVRPASPVGSLGGGGGGGGAVCTSPAERAAASAPTPTPLMREARIMMQMRHRNVAPLVEVIDDPADGFVYLVMPYLERGPVIKVRPDGTSVPLDLDIARGLLRQMSAGLLYLHNHHVLHRDLKPENILMDADGIVYLSDFGTGEFFTDGAQLRHYSGTPAYAAPEMLSGEGFSGPPVDVWALGVTFYMMVFGRQPFTGTTLRELNQSILEGTIDFQTVPGGENTHGPHGDEHSPHHPHEGSQTFEDAVDLLRRMLHRDPCQRITCAEVREHAFLYQGLRRRHHHHHHHKEHSHHKKAGSPPPPPLDPAFHRLSDSQQHDISSSQLASGPSLALTSSSTVAMDDAPSPPHPHETTFRGGVPSPVEDSPKHVVRADC